MICLNQSILQLYQTYKNLQEWVQAGLLVQSLIILLVFESKIFGWKHLYPLTKRIKPSILD